MLTGTHFSVLQTAAKRRKSAGSRRCAARQPRSRRRAGNRESTSVSCFTLRLVYSGRVRAGCDERAGYTTDPAGCRPLEAVPLAGKPARPPLEVEHRHSTADSRYEMRLGPPSASSRLEHILRWWWLWPVWCDCNRMAVMMTSFSASDLAKMDGWHRHATLRFRGGFCLAQVRGLGSEQGS